MTKKLQKDLVKGDVIRTEFGDYDNWVTVVVDSVKDRGGYCGCCLTVHYQNSDKTFKMYGCANSLVEVVKEAD